MSDAFTNFLGGAVSGTLDTGANLKDYQHADRLYARSNFARAPKVGFLYYVVFNITPAAIVDSKWSAQKKSREVGVLVKRIDMPKFDIETEVLNQYNRKTVIQKGLKYMPISLDMHDDNSDITHDLWKNYYKFYYYDGNYGAANTEFTPKEFVNTKYADIPAKYGIKNNSSTTPDPFFQSIDIYVLHQHKFTKMKLINPVVIKWDHDTLNQDEGNKILSNKMSIAYETVLYDSGTITPDNVAGGFTSLYYDKSPSPLSVGGNGTATLLGTGGVLNGASSVFGALSDGNFLGAALLARTTLKNASSLNLASLTREGYSITGSILGDLRATSNQPNGVRDNINQGNLGQLGSIGVSLFKNNSVVAETRAVISTLTTRGLTGTGG